jgi:hypothetical protein
MASAKALYFVVPHPIEDGKWKIACRTRLYFGNLLSTGKEIHITYDHQNDAQLDCDKLNKKCLGESPSRTLKSLAGV